MRYHLLIVILCCCIGKTFAQKTLCFKSDTLTVHVSLVCKDLVVKPGRDGMLVISENDFKKYRGEHCTISLINWRESYFYRSRLFTKNEKGEKQVFATSFTDLSLTKLFEKKNNVFYLEPKRDLIDRDTAGGATQNK